MWNGIHVTYQLFFSNFSETWIFSIDFLRILFFFLIRHLGADLFHAYGRNGRTDRSTDRHDESESLFAILAVRRWGALQGYNFHIKLREHWLIGCKVEIGATHASNDVCVYPSPRSSNIIRYYTCVANLYGLDGPRIKSQRGRLYPCAVRPAPRPTRAACIIGTVFSRE